MIQLTCATNPPRRFARLRVVAMDFVNRHLLDRPCSDEAGVSAAEWHASRGATPPAPGVGSDS